MRSDMELWNEVRRLASELSLLTSDGRITQKFPYDP